mmetsp:Transcript_69770/g.123082  ORF Transcript_69770/g.123082 Transcript_69770/m.123082 type:complete len:236 (+) Transcript_69770:2464-3171(+)
MGVPDKHWVQVEHQHGLVDIHVVLLNSESLDQQAGRCVRRPVRAVEVPGLQRQHLAQQPQVAALGHQVGHGDASLRPVHNAFDHRWVPGYQAFRCQGQVVHNGVPHQTLDFCGVHLGPLLCKPGVNVPGLGLHVRGKLLEAHTVVWPSLERFESVQAHHPRNQEVVADRRATCQQPLAPCAAQAPSVVLAHRTTTVAGVHTEQPPSGHRGIAPGASAVAGVWPHANPRGRSQQPP